MVHSKKCNGTCEGHLFNFHSTIAGMIACAFRAIELILPAIGIRMRNQKKGGNNVN
jgi:hypothetical protein